MYQSHKWRVLAQYRCCIYLVFETNTWHNSFRRHNIKKLFVRKSTAQIFLKVVVSKLWQFRACLRLLQKNSSWHIKNNYNFYLLRGLEKITFYSDKLSLITTKFIINFYSIEGLSCQCLKKKSVEAFLLEMAPKTGYLSVSYGVNTHEPP